MESYEIAELRRKLGLNKSAFGRMFGVGGTQIDRWEKGISHPPAARIKMLQEKHREYRADRITEKGVVYEAGNMAGMTVRQIADIIYKDLSREARSRVDGEYAAAVMRELAKYEQSKGDDDEKT